MVRQSGLFISLCEKITRPEKDPYNWKYLGFYLLAILFSIGGGAVPRQLHQALSGKVFSFDDLPYIGDMYGQRVHGLPRDLPNCGCKMAPVLEFEVEDE